MNWKNIYDHLKNAGYDVYPPAVHTGDCKSFYIVIKRSIASRGMSMEKQQYELLLYIPYGKYAAIEDRIADVKACMNQLYPSLKLIEYDDPVYPDDDVKGYMTTLTYQVSKPTTMNRI